jgi:chorismate dehydratase
MGSAPNNISLALVNYINARPFAYGLDHYSEVSFEIILANPAECASLFEIGKTDIALVPVGALHDFDDYQIVTDYCIGCDGEVRTVCLFSNENLENCHTVYLDDHSRTSVLLCKLIIEDYFGLKPRYIKAHVEDIHLTSGEAKLMIGDKVFVIEDDFKYKYDLGSLWKEWHNLPFAFAVWIARPSVSLTVISHLNNALKDGLSHIVELGNNDVNLEDYFSKYISYHLTDDKRRAIDLFLTDTKKLL